jgi:hypothetical protein
MSRRTTISVGQTRRIPRFFGKQRAGVSFASSRCQAGSPLASRLVSVLVAALSCGLWGSCIVTNAEEFAEEVQVPPIVLNTPDQPIGSIIGYDASGTDPDVRLNISVRDDNIDDTLVVHAEVSVVGQPTTRICPTIDIVPSGRPERAQFGLLIPRANIRPGACNQVMVYVSREFVGTCADPIGFGRPQRSRTDIATAMFWIWETRDNPTSNDKAALGVTSTCQVMTHADTSASMPTGQ